VGVLNLLLALASVWIGQTLRQMPPQEFERHLKERSPDSLEEIKRRGLTVEDILNVYGQGFTIGGGVGIIASALTILGAVRMLMLKSHGLAIFASILAAIPCVSLTACFGLGLGIGIWSLVVLLSNDVSTAFRRSGNDPGY
jgi:hypothetical protein